MPTTPPKFPASRFPEHTTGPQDTLPRARVRRRALQHPEGPESREPHPVALLENRGQQRRDLVHDSRRFGLADRPVTSRQPLGEPRRELCLRHISLPCSSSRYGFGDRVFGESPGFPSEHPWLPPRDPSPRRGIRGLRGRIPWCHRPLREEDAMRSAAAVLVALLAVLGAPPADAGTVVTVPAGTKVLLKFLEPLDSSKAKEGDVVKFEIAADVLVDRYVIFRLGD